GRIVGVIIATNVIVQIPAGCSVDEAVDVPQIVEVDDLPRERQQVQFDVGREGPGTLRNPVEAEIAEELIGAFGHQEDVVAPLAEVVVLARAAAEDVVAADVAETGEQVEDVAVVAEHAAVVAFAVEDPVVALAAKHRLGPHRAVDDDVVAGSAEMFAAIVGAEQEVVPVAAEEDVTTE